MEWLGLFIWVLVAALALPLAALGSLTSPWLGLQSLLALGGLVFCVLFIAIGGGWLAWTSTGLALAGAVALGLGAARLASDEPRTASAGQMAEEHAASLAGFELPLLPTVAFVMLLVAVDVATVG